MLFVFPSRRRPVSVSGCAIRRCLSTSSSSTSRVECAASTAGPAVLGNGHIAGRAGALRAGTQGRNRGARGAALPPLANWCFVIPQSTLPARLPLKSQSGTRRDAHRNGLTGEGGGRGVIRIISRTRGSALPSSIVEARRRMPNPSCSSMALPRDIATNWINPGWLKTLGDGGYRVVAFDHRGHGQSSVEP